MKEALGFDPYQTDEAYDDGMMAKLRGNRLIWIDGSSISTSGLEVELVHELMHVPNYAAVCILNEEDTAYVENDCNG